MSITTTDGCAVVEDGTLAPPAGTQTGDETTTGTGETAETGKAPDENEGSKAPRLRSFDRLAQLATVEGWLAFLAERVNEAVEQAIKDDGAFVPPMKAEEVEALLAEGLALIVPEVAPKLEALAKACAGARDARLKREAAHRVSCKRTKTAAAKVAKDRAAVEAEAEKLRARLKSLETALGPSKAAATETPKPTEPTT